MTVLGNENGFTIHSAPSRGQVIAEKKGGLAARQKGLPQSRSGITPTRNIWSSVRAEGEKANRFENAKQKAEKAMQLPNGVFLKNPEKNSMRIQLRLDGRHNRPAEYKAKIISEDGVTRAEAWGAKTGKAHSYCDPINSDKLDRDALDDEGKRELQKALHIAREIITGKKEYASADESGPESGSDTSDDDI